MKFTRTLRCTDVSNGAIAALTFSLTVSLSATLASAQQLPEKFTIPQVLSSPFPTELVSSGDGSMVAWIFDERGASNVWVARAPEWRGERLTNFPAETGLEVSTPSIVPGGSDVVFVRGGAANARGEFPNPAHDPSGTREVVMLATSGGNVREIGEGSSPEVSPDGKRVAFTRRGEVWIASLVDSSRPSRLFSARGTESNLRWSPDGSAIAFASARGDHGFVGVYDLRARKLAYVDPSVDRDHSPIWSPDGRQVAFVREAALTRTVVHTPRRSGTPWSIRVADPATGHGRELWVAQPGAGSFFRRTDAHDQIEWTRDGHIIFPWERTGWLHLYAIPASGGVAAELTPGQFEVIQTTPSLDRSGVLYSSNQNDIDRRHIWSVAPGSAPRELLSGTGTRMGARCNHRRRRRASLRCAVARATGSARWTVRSPTSLASAIPADFPARDMVTPIAVTFRATDGLLLHGQLFLPPNENAGRHAAIVFYHGGSQRQMLLGWHSMGYYHNAYGLNQYLASRGYVVLSVNYRGGIGYGLDFREPLNYGPGGGTEMRDAIGAAHYLRSRADVDASRIGVWGGSYGGYMTAMSLARDPTDYKVGVDFAGVHDWVIEYNRMIDTWDEDREMAARRVAYASSPMFDLSKWRAPVLLIQGDDDRNVVFSQTVQLAEDLRKRGVHVETIVYPDETHEWLLHQHWIDSYEATAAFLERYLK